jgi:hypothetical protein
MRRSVVVFAPGRPEQHEELAVGDLQRHLAEGGIAAYLW